MTEIPTRSTTYELGMADDFFDWTADELALYLKGLLQAKEASDFVVEVLEELQNLARNNERGVA